MVKSDIRNPVRHFVEGRWIWRTGEAAIGENPSDLSDVGEYQQADERLVRQAVAAVGAAQAAWGDNSYRLTSLDPAFHAKMKKAEEIMGRYRNTLHVLSK
jgi:acyl-CoA reductase-like NAD-dependent aldehyde dehydrogenase